MLKLYVIRHGIAGKSLDNELQDEARSLTKKGRDKIKEIAKGMKELAVEFDLVITSPLLRAKESAEIINDYCGSDHPLIVSDLLRPGSSYEELIKFLNSLKDNENIAIIGHEPFLSGFSSYCLSKSKNPFLTIKKGGALILEMEGAIKPGQCKLSWLMDSKQLIECAR